MRLRAVRYLLLWVLTFFVGVGNSVVLSSCTSCQRQTIETKLDFEVNVDDPVLQKLVVATKLFTIKASGELRAGKYTFRGQRLEVDANTKFELDMTVEFDGTTKIKTKAANGKLTLTTPVKIDGVTSPTSVELEHGKATVEMDFARALFCIVVEALQYGKSKEAQDSSIAELAKLPANISVEKARLDIKEGAKIDLSGVNIVFGEGCFLSLEDVKFQNMSDYAGSLQVSLNATKGSSARVNDTTCEVAGAKISFIANAQCQDGMVTVEAEQGKESPAIALTGCRVHLVKGTSIEGKPSDVHVSFDCQSLNLAVNKLKLSGKQNSGDPDIDVAGEATIGNLAGSLNLPGQSVSGVIPGPVHGVVTYQTAGKARSASLNLDSGVTATNIRWKMTDDGVECDLQLREVKLSKLSGDTANGVVVKLDSATVKPGKFAWKGASSFDLALDQGSRLSVNAPIVFAYKNGKAEMPAQIPFSIKSGTMVIADTGGHKLNCSKLNGQCKLMHTAEGVKFDSTFAMNLSSQNDLMGIEGFNGRIGSLKLSGTNKHLLVQLIDVAISIDEKDLVATIKSRLPNPFTRSVNEELLAKQKWRYRKLNLRKVTVTNPKINDLKFTQQNEIDVDGEGDLTVEGTVEAYHQKLNPFSKTPSEWKEHNWQASAHVHEKGKLDYKILPGASLADSKIHLDAVMETSMPENIKFDWSKVAGDTLAKAENVLMQNAVKGAKTLTTPGQTVAMKFSHDRLLFRSPSRSLKAIKVKTFTTTPDKDRLSIKFSGEAKF